MSYNYIVSYGSSSTGPWTQSGTTAATSFTINNLGAGTNYWVQVITVDSVSQLQSTPFVAGPFQTSAASNIPAPAASVGYNQRTYGPNVTLGTNWFLNGTPNGFIQNGDGSATDNPPSAGVPNPYNAHAVSCLVNNGQVTQGVAFSGGFYAECTFKFTGTAGTFDAVQGNGWPSFWCTGGLGLDSAPMHVEVDFMEWFNGTNAQFNSGVIDWFGPNQGTWWGSGQQGYNDTCDLSALSHDMTQYHKVGTLWVPATSTSQGYLKTYFDGVQVGPTHVWDIYNGGTIPNGYTGGNSPPFSSLDVTHVQLLLGTGTLNPMTVSAVEVWQRDNSANLGNVSTGGGGGGTTGTGGGPFGTGNAFTDSFTTLNTNLWSNPPTAFDDGGTGWFSDNSLVTPHTKIYTGGHMDLALTNIAGNTYGPTTGNSYGAPSGKLYFAGITDTFNSPNNFQQQYGYWEITCSVDKVPGLGLFCFTLSALSFPPNFAMPNIWTDGSNTMQLMMFPSSPSGQNLPTYSLSEGQSFGGSSTWSGTQKHTYGMKWTPSTISFYIDRVQVLSLPNPGGVYSDGSHPCYTKIHTQSNFYPALLNATSSLLPAYGHVYAFNVWTQGASPV